MPKWKLTDITTNSPILRVFSAAGTENVYSFVYHHGPAIESELVAYRIYFNEKQTVDPYSKVNKRLEIKETCFYPTKAQRANGYGDDALRVYNSGGVGALKGWNGTEATHIKPVVNRTERVLASGPVRAIVEAEVIGWEYQGNDLNMINRYTIYGGHRDMKVDVLFDRPLKQEVFAAGVQILKEGGHMSDHKGLTGSWGTDWPVTDTIGYVKETTGMGTFIPKYIGKEVQDGSNYLYTLQAPGQQHFHYYVTFTSKKKVSDLKIWKTGSIIFPNGEKNWNILAKLRLNKKSKTMKRLITLCLLGGCFLSAPAQNYVSQAWVADQGNGTYKNPVLYADYSDPDICRVGDDYYLTSSSFNCLPGLQSNCLPQWDGDAARQPQAE